MAINPRTEEILRACWDDMKAPTPEQLEILRPLLTWGDVSFPNGSNHKIQSLPYADYFQAEDKSVELAQGRWYGGGWYCQFADGSTCIVSPERVSVGEGVDLGANFNSRDRALKAFI